MERTHLCFSSVECQHANVQVRDLVGNGLPIAFNRTHLAKICNDIHGLEVLVVWSALFGDFLQLLFHLLFVSGNHTNVEAFPRKFLAHCQSNTIRSACDHSPGSCVTLQLIAIFVVGVLPSLHDWPNCVPPKEAIQGPGPLGEFPETKCSGCSQNPRVYI